MPEALPKKGDPQTIYVIDISSYVFRAYHALPPLSNSKGEPTHAVAGVASMLLKLLREREPHGVIVAMDSKGKSFRKELYADYKANRPPAPPDLEQQMVRVREIAEAWGMSPLEAPGFEADDIIATLVKQARGKGRRVVIVSADKDLLQLVGPDVVMYDTMRDKVFGAEETREKLGVEPGQVRDLLALMGDSSDNVPGVPSVGQKTAAKLLAEYGSLDGIYENLEGITRKALKAKLGEHRDKALSSRELVTLRDDVPIGTDAVTREYGGGNTAALRTLFSELELTRLLAQLDPAPAIEGHYETIATEEGLARIATIIREVGSFAMYTVMDIDDPIRAELVGVALSWVEGVSAYIPLGHRYIGAPDQLSVDDARAVLGPLLENSLIPKRTLAKREEVFWARRGITLRGVRFDPSLASYLLDPGRHAHRLEDLARQELDGALSDDDAVRGKGKKALTWDEVEVVAVAQHANERADYTFRLSELLTPRMHEGEFERLFFDVELPLASVLATMELTGIRVDTGLLEELSNFSGRRASESPRAVHRAGRPRLQRLLSAAARDHPVRRARLAGRQKDEDRALDRPGGPRRPLAPAPAAAGDSRISLCFEAQEHVFRRVATGGEPGNRTHSHPLQPAGRRHRPPFFERTEPAEHPDPDRDGPQGARCVRAKGGLVDALGRLLPD